MRSPARSSADSAGAGRVRPRGARIGGAVMNEKHSNFLTNAGGATAADLENLGEIVRKRVLNSSGIQLEWEIKRIGINPAD